MNRGNVLMAIDDAEVQALAAQCHATFTAFAQALSPRDLILAAVLHAEKSDSHFLESVTAYLTHEMAGWAQSMRDVRFYNDAFNQWMDTEREELGEVRAPSVNFQ